MGFRFRRSFGLRNGARLNITKHGFSSVSIGRRGATVNVGDKGVRGTVGLPGTGLSYTTGTQGGPILVVIAMVWAAVGVVAALVAGAFSWLRRP